jgi:hypothetical protein
MGIKTLGRTVSGKFSKQMLTVQKHSPVLLFGVGMVGIGATVVLACRATLKLSDTLAEGEEHLKKVEVVVKEGTDEGEEEVKKAGFSVRLDTAIKIAKLYAPAVIIGVASVGAMTGSHVILKRRNAGLAAAYAIVDKGFKDYRARVIKDQGAEKDLEYRFGIAEREIVEEGPNGPEVKIIRGLDQQAMKANEKYTYARVFDRDNPNWSEIPHQNQMFINNVLQHCRDHLQIHGHLFLADVYDMLGFERTKASMQVGWIKGERVNPETGQKTDGYVDFGIWDQGMYKGKEWINGNLQAFELDFNVDGPILHALDKM